MNSPQTGLTLNKEVTKCTSMPSETKFIEDKSTCKIGSNHRREPTRFKRPTALITERNRSESPITRSRSRQNDNHNRQSDGERYDFEALQNELEKKSGVLKFGSQVIHAEMDDFTNEGCLGAGTCSVVFKMRYRCNPNFVMAVKQMRRSYNCQEENKRIMMDLNVVTKSYDCANIVECYGIFFTAGDVWICMEVMPTCLDKLLHDLQRPFPERVLGKITVAITTALDYLKSKHNVMHRDVKPSNMLLSYHGVIKLCDFGISGKLKDSIARSRQLGCIGYMAPERLNTPTYDVRADIWSLGISLLELATGSFPYTGTEIEFAIMSKIISDPPPSLPHHIPFTSAFRHFVDLCLKKDHNERPKYRVLMTTEFFVRYNREPFDVLDWLKGLPLSHLRNSSDFVPPTEDNNGTKTPTKATAPIIDTNNLASSPDSSITLSPDISRGLSNTSLDDSVGSRKLVNESSMQHNLDVTLVAAPNINTIYSPGTISGDPNTTHSNKLVKNDLSIAYPANGYFCQSDKDQGSTDAYLGRPEFSDKSVAAKMLSQASSGYGSAGSDCSPGSLGSESRSPSTTQMSDLISLSKGVNGIPPAIPPRLKNNKEIPPKVAIRKPCFENNTHKSSTSSANPGLASTRIASSCYSRRSKDSATCSDQWSTSSSSSRTMHHFPTQGIPQHSNSGSVGPLIQMFETDNRDHNSYSGVKHTVPMVPARSNHPEMQNGQIMKHEDTTHPTQIRRTNQVRSSSVGAQLQRSPAQRWVTRPSISKKQDQTLFDSQHFKNSPSPLGCQTTVIDRRISGRNTPSPSPSPINSNLLSSHVHKNTSPQQYHHQYYYYYYDNPSPHISRAMTPPLPLGAMHSNQCTTKNRYATPEQKVAPLGMMCKTPSLSGRMCQRLYTHPMPKQSHLNDAFVSSADHSKPYTQFPHDSLFIASHPSSNHPNHQSSFNNGVVRTGTIQKDTSYSSNLGDRLHCQGYSHLGSNNNLTQPYRSSSQPPKSRDWLSFETEL